MTCDVDQVDQNDLDGFEFGLKWMHTDDNDDATDQW